MSAVEERTIEVRGFPVRVWESGEGEPVGYLAGILGLSQWTPYLERIAETRRVIVPSIPGFPGADGHQQLDDVSDWVCAMLDLIDASGLSGCDLIGASIGGTLAAEAAAFSQASVRRLVLLAPLGLHVPDLPVPNFWAYPPKRIEQIVAESGVETARQLAQPEDVDEVEWSIVTRRAITAGARFFWPMIDVGLAKRLYRVKAPACILWGTNDAIASPDYAKLFAKGIAGPTEVALVSGAGHLLDWDRPEDAAERTLRFLA